MPHRLGQQRHLMMFAQPLQPAAYLHGAIDRGQFVGCFFVRGQIGCQASQLLAQVFLQIFTGQSGDRFAELTQRGTEPGQLGRFESRLVGRQAIVHAFEHRRVLLVERQRQLPAQVVDQ